jgi:hypothetical protein
VTEIVVMPDDGSYQIQGPDVAVISWIPYAYDFAEMAPNEFTQHRRAYGFQMLFDSGNVAPPESFSGHGEFLTFLEAKEFRGAICLRDLVLTCSENGTPIDLQWTPEKYVGYTPLRYGRSDERRKITFRHDKGQQNEESDALTELDSQGVRRTRSFFFRVGWLGNLASWYFTRSGAPWVGMAVDYRIESNGSVQVQFGGSFIPSHHVYVDWKAVGGHDMLAVSAETINEFLNTGRNQFAPGGIFAV